MSCVFISFTHLATLIILGGKQPDPRPCTFFNLGSFYPTGQMSQGAHVFLGSHQVRTMVKFVL